MTPKFAFRWNTGGAPKKTSPSNMLLQEDIDLCQTAFNKIDIENKGYLEPQEVRLLYHELGVTSVTELDVMDMMRKAEVHDDGILSFAEFLQLVELHGGPISTKDDSEADTLLAFVSMGGSAGGDGKVDVARLSKTCSDFGLTIDIESLVKDMDTDGDGFIDFDEFKSILTSPKKQFKKANGDIPKEHSLLTALRKGRGGSFLPETHSNDPNEEPMSP